MRQLLHSMKDGSAQLVDVPMPSATGPTLLVESRASVISVGTERAATEFGRASWLERVRAQPEKVIKVLDKIRTDGVASTMETVRRHLDTPLALGYCQAGIVREVGPAAEGFAIGDRVVTNGPHAEFVRVPHTLAARIPEGVPFEAAAFTPLGAIGLQGLRLAQPTLGETVVVYGLGLIGLLTVQIARAAGCRVIGIDRAADRCRMAEEFGAIGIAAGDDTDIAPQVRVLTGDLGADVVLLTLATESDEPMHAAAQMSRKRGRVVLVGVTGLNLKRGDFYEKELSFQVSCSYGPGRYDPVHEAKGIDYPVPFVRWTEARNFSAVLQLMKDGSLDPRPLISRTFDIADVQKAYDAIASEQSVLGVVLKYPSAHASAAQTTIELSPASATATRVAGTATVGWIGAGAFSAGVLIPAFRRAGAQLHSIASAGGTSAAVVGKQHGFQRASTDAVALLSDATLDTVVIATRHAAHASWATKALAAGKHVFVEKPLALTHAEVDAIEDALAHAPGGTVLCVGFNRRFAPEVDIARTLLRSRTGPLAIVMTINAGAIPRADWTQDREVGGGRIIGEACHFIDLARSLCGSPIRSLQVLTARGEDGAAINDVAALQLAFVDGSVASIQYLANGHKTLSKERVELFFDGRVLRIDDFNGIEAYGAKVPKTSWRRGQDKGHAALARAFISAIRAGGPSPIEARELLEVSRVSIDAAQLADRGGGTIEFGAEGRSVAR